MKVLKRILVLIMSLLVLLGMMNVSVFAAESQNANYEKTDPYVLGSKVVDSDYAYANYWGFGTTPYESKFIIEKNNNSQYNMTDNACLFNLISPDKLSNTPKAEQKGPWASILTYCVDVRVDINSQYKYRRINLEDSSYFDVAASQRLRTIVNNGITSKTAKEVQDLVNDWLKKNGKDPISDVTAEEVLAAAQYSIWYVANENELKGTPTVYNRYGSESWYGVWNHESAHDYIFSYDVDGGKVSINSRLSESDTAKTNIETMVQYYLSLKGTPAKQVAVSDSSLSELNVDWTKQENGTYTATISYNVDKNLSLDTTSDLTISALKDDTALVTQKLTKTGSGSLVVTGLDKPCDLTLEINGYQKVSDVFFFDAVGDRYASQTLIGYDDSKLPVHAEATLAISEGNLFYGKLEVTKEVLVADEHYANDKTYYVTLFEDEALTKIAEGTETKAIYMNGKAVNSVQYDNLAIGKTYYVAETDANGTVLEEGDFGTTTIKVADQDGDNQLVAKEELQTVTITNCYETDEYFYQEDEEQPVDTDEETATEDEVAESASQTGDDSSMAGYIALMAIALVAMGVAVFRRRKNQ